MNEPPQLDDEQSDEDGKERGFSIVVGSPERRRRFGAMGNVMVRSPRSRRMDKEDETEDEE